MSGIGGHFGLPLAAQNIFWGCTPQNDLLALWLPSEKGSTGKVCTSGCGGDPRIQTLVFPTPVTRWIFSPQRIFRGGPEDEHWLATASDEGGRQCGCRVPQRRQPIINWNSYYNYTSYYTLYLKPNPPIINPSLTFLQPNHFIHFILIIFHHSNCEFPTADLMSGLP